MPLILLSHVNDEEEQVRALEAGADDYVTKPFRPRELVARLRANLRRPRPIAEEPCVELHGLEVDLARRSVRRDREEIHLTPIEFKLLAALLRNRGRLMTYQGLLQEVWGAAYVNDIQTLCAHMANLRRTIESEERPRLIRTDHRVGCRLADWCSDRPAPALPPEVVTNPPRSRSACRLTSSESSRQAYAPSTREYLRSRGLSPYMRGSISAARPLRSGSSRP